MRILHKPRPRQNRGTAAMEDRCAKVRQDGPPALPVEHVEARLPDKPATVRFLDLKYGECKWIPGAPAADAMCCGDPCADGMSYCQFHARVVYGPARTPAQLAGDAIRAATMRLNRAKKMNAADAAA